LEEAERVAQQLNEDANGEIDYISKPPPPRSSGIGEIEMKSIKDDPPLTIEKSNILCLGPTGVGKTLMIRTLARVLEVPFSMSDCTPFTQAGYVGEDADVCVHRLLAASNWDVKKAEQGIVCLDEFDKLSKPRVNHGSKDIAGEVRISNRNWVYGTNSIREFNKHYSRSLKEQP
jgi:ATP-dependent protease Clp ATPase subunit